MKPRILVVSPWGLAGGYSGPLTLLDRLFSAVVRVAHAEVDVAYLDRGREAIPIWAHRTSALLETTQGRLAFATQLLWSWRAFHHLRRNARHYDLIHLQGCYLLNLLPLWGVRGVDVAVIPVLENGDLRITGSARVAWVKRKLTRSLLRRVTVAFALSSGIRAELDALGVTSERVVDLGNVVSTDEFGWSGRGRESGRPVRLGFVGKLGTTKQPHLVVRAMDILADQGVRTSAIFVGPFADEDYRTFFEGELAQSQVADTVTLTGFTSDPAAYVKHSMDVFVLPSQAEGMPGALAEAMVSGLPCIVTDRGAMGESVREAGCGVVVEPDAASIASAISLLSEESRWQDMSAAATAYGQTKFSDIAVAATYSQHALARVETVNVASQRVASR